jgi:transcriptional antiterminator
VVFLRIAIRKLNNSALLAKDISRDKEIIIMGKGISFKYKKGQKISAEDIESVFVLNDRDKSEDYIQQFEQTSQEYVEITQILVDDIQSEFNIVMPELFFTALMDHIQFAVYRCRHNMRIENRMAWILQRMYPEEFK